MIAIVTHRGQPDGVADDHALARAIVDAGGRPAFVAWDDHEHDWTSAAVVVLRSTWDYHLRIDEWRRWVGRVRRSSVLVNDAELLLWNSDKAYLLDLEARGVPIVPTALVEEGSGLARVCAARHWSDIVVKPAVGASAAGARRFAGSADAPAAAGHVDTLARTGKVLVQPYQSSVELERERSLVMIDGECCHAFSKPPFHHGTENVELLRHEVTEEELAVALLALEAFPLSPVIARIDLIPTGSGPRLMEAEAIEPQLALGLHMPTAGRLAASLMRIAHEERADASAHDLSS